MTRTSPEPPPNLSAETRAVLDAIIAHPDPLGLRLNELAGVTGMPVASIGRQLRALEGDRLTSFGVGRWRATLRGRRIADELARRPPEHDSSEDGREPGGRGRSRGIAREAARPRRG